MPVPKPSFRPWTALCLGLACASPLTATADEVPMLRGKPSREQIVEALAAPPASEAPRGMRTRGLSLGPAAAATAPAPVERKLDLQIHFDFNSDRLTQEGMDVLDQLGAALNSAELNYVKRITLEGHTDATGSEAYNQDLSRRRAESVRSYLNSRHGMGGRRMQTVGKGASELADPANPDDAVNRRVRIAVDG